MATKKLIEAGKLTERITIDRKTVSSDTLPNGDLTTTWVVLMTTWARVTMLSGTEQIESGRLESQNRIEVVMRYRFNNSIAVGDRISWRNRNWIVEPGLVIDEDRTLIKMGAVIDSKDSSLELV